MPLLLFLFCYLVTLTASLNSEYDTLWESYKVAFNKTYPTYVEERSRRQIWEKNMQVVRRHNSGENSKHYSFNLGMNHLSDMAPAEYREITGLRILINLIDALTYRQRNHRTFPKSSYKNAPRFIDWRLVGVVSPVKNQGNCGSCWAITAVESLEAQQAKKTGILVPLSAQNLVDCAVGRGTDGCVGGNMNAAFRFIARSHGVDTEESYPYQGREGYCRFRRSTVGATVHGLLKIRQFDENALMHAVAKYGPVAAGINALCYGFIHYKSGIYEVENCSPLTLNHAVLIVGYGTTSSGKDYWICKNSWSPYWGENGYIRIRRNNNNQCGIASLASLPIVQKRRI